MENLVITGSTRGIGLAMAIEFLKAGCHVTLSGRGETLSDAARFALEPFENQYIYYPYHAHEKAIKQAWHYVYNDLL